MHFGIIQDLTEYPVLYLMVNKSSVCLSEDSISRDIRCIDNARGQQDD